MEAESTINRHSLKKRAIGKVPLLLSLPANTQDNLCNLLSLKEFQKGETLLLSQQKGSEMMFIVDGSVDVKRTSGAGKEVILSRLGIGSFVGEIALLTDTTRSADVVAAEECMVLILQENDFEALLSAHHTFARALLNDLANRVAAASTKISDLALLDVYCRVHRTLRTLASKDAQGNHVVKDRPTHKELAAMVGTSREMITRALAKLEEDELIIVQGNSLKILGNTIES